MDRGNLSPLRALAKLLLGSLISDKVNWGNITKDQLLKYILNPNFRTIKTQLTQSATLFPSGSTLFGNTIEDSHYMTGSVSSTGSLTFNAHKVTEISDDTTLADANSTSLVTENATETNRFYTSAKSTGTT